MSEVVTGTGVSFKDFIGNSSTGIIGVLNGIFVPIIFAFAFAAFIWGVVKFFFLNGGSEEGRAEGRQFVLWGILGMVVLLSVWGLVRMLLSTLGIAP